MFDHRVAFSKAENDWKYINMGLINRWEIRRVPDLKTVQVKINDITIEPSSTTDTHIIYDFGKLRKQWFELIGNTPAECNLIALEDACFYAQLKALNHYSKHPNKEELRECVFTPELTIFIKPVWDYSPKPPTIIEIDEYYVTSDIHKETYKS